MRKLTLLLAAFTVGLASPSTRAQERVARPPALQLLAGEGAGERKPLALANADVRVVLVGPLAETTATLTFRNDTPRQLEGELTFPLPDGATVTGFGLDVNGELVDGVPVARELARLTYEQETHKRVDPGLVEQTVGNNFRTRIYPIPPNGKRTVKVQYVSDLPIGVDGAAYRLPINWGQGIDAMNVRIEATEPSADLSAKLGDEAMKFEAQESQQVATQSFKAIKPDADLAVTVKNPALRQVLVEKRVRPVTMDEVLNHRLGELGRGENYFLVSDTPMFRVEGMAKRNAPMHVGIAWDASLSRAQTDKTHELAVLRRLFARLDPTAVITLVTFRNEPDAPRTFAAKDAGKLLDELTKLAYDGGTNLGALALVRDAQRLPGSPGSDKAAPPIDYWLLFTDGMADLGPALPKKAEVPVYTITDDTSANYALLRAIAGESGGAFLDLQRIDSAQAVNRLEEEPLSLLGVDYKEGEVADLYPRGPQSVNGHVLVSGKLLVAEATLLLKYGANGIVQHRVKVTVKRDGATRTGLVPRFWAERKVADLSADVTANASAIEEVGKSFSLVTPNTSLLVLETAEQYVEHGIVPPANRKDVYEKFAQLIEQRRVREQQTREQRLNEVLALWDARVKWWEQKHEYPEHFVYADERKKLAAARGGEVDGLTPALRGASTQPANEPAVAAQRLADRNDTESFTRFAGAGAPAPLASIAAPDAAKTGKPGGGEGLGGPSIQVKPWDPDVPYLKAMREAGPDGAYAAYLKNRPAYVASPAFYLDCAEYLLAHDQKALGLRVLTNIAELKLESAPLLRIVAHRLEQAGERDLAIDLFERIKMMRPEEPQSWRDLALALDDRARWRIAGVSIPGSAAPAVDDAHTAARADFQRAIELLEHVVMTKWDRFPEIELPTLTEANAMIERAKGVFPAEGLKIPLDSRLVKNLDCDVRIVLTWDADLTDVDLWVTEPSGEKCVYDHNRTTIGGLLSHDFTQGYGPEEYCLHSMMSGAYKVQAHYYGSTQTSLVGPVTIQATVITHFGRPDERRQALTVRLDKPKDVVDLGTVTLGK